MLSQECITAMAMAFVKLSIIDNTYFQTAPVLMSMIQPPNVNFSGHTILVNLKLILSRVVTSEHVTMSWVADILVNVLQVS